MVHKSRVRSFLGERFKPKEPVNHFSISLEVGDDENDSVLESTISTRTSEDSQLPSLRGRNA